MPAASLSAAAQAIGPLSRRQAEPEPSLAAGRGAGEPLQMGKLRHVFRVPGYDGCMCFAARSGRCKSRVDVQCTGDGRDQPVMVCAKKHGMRLRAVIWLSTASAVSIM